MSLPSPPSTESLPSPGSHTNVSSPAPEEGRVVALSAVDQVVAVAAAQPVVAVAAGDQVVALAAVDGDLDQGGQAVAGGERVVPAVQVDDQVLGGADVQEERRRADAIETNAAAVGGHGIRLGHVAAVVHHGVRAVAALVEVAAVAGVPDHLVVARLAEGPDRRRRRR